MSTGLDANRAVRRTQCRRDVVRVLACTEQFRAMALTQLIYGESVCDIELCLSALPWTFFRASKLELKATNASLRQKSVLCSSSTVG